MIKFIGFCICCLIFSNDAFSFGEGVCVTFADGHGQCISDIDKNSDAANVLRKQASDSFKPSNATKENNDYISRSKDSAIDMLIKSTQKYKQGTLSKDRYVEIAMQVGQMAEYANNSSEKNVLAEPVKQKDIKVADKILKVTQPLPFGSPNIENLSDEKLTKLENTEIPLLREKFKKLQSSQKDLKDLELNLKCASDADCIPLPVGQKMCGGPVSYLIVSQLDSNFASIDEKLKKYKELDYDLQKTVHGFAGTCDFIMPPKTSCLNNVCSAQ